MVDKNFLEGYGCIKIDYKENQGKRYYIYAFRNDLLEWDFNQGKLVFVTQNKNVIERIKRTVPTIEEGELFCKECFRKKDVEELMDETNTKYWIKSFWKKAPVNVKEELQNRILYMMPKMNWSNVKSITEDEDNCLFYGICSNCVPEGEFYNNQELKLSRKILTDIWEKVIADELIKGSEELLEDYLSDYIDIIEEGMEFLNRQVKVENGIIDILAKDKNGTKCIIELKVNGNDKNIIWQTAYYPACFEEDTRMITIAPNYSPKIYKALNNVKNVELKIFQKSIEGVFEIHNYSEELPEIEECEEEIMEESNDQEDVFDEEILEDVG